MTFNNGLARCGEMKSIVLLFLLILPRPVFGEALKTYLVSGESMSPVLVSGDTVVVSADETIRRSDLVAVRFKQSATPLVKRVVAVGGDRLEIKERAFFVNGERVGNFDGKRWKSTVNQLEYYGWRVPPDHFFILGDNPGNSRDSRRLGLIARDQIEGKVVRVIKN